MLSQQLRKSLSALEFGNMTLRQRIYWDSSIPALPRQRTRHPTERDREIPQRRFARGRFPLAPDVHLYIAVSLPSPSPTVKTSHAKLVVSIASSL